MSFLAGSGNFKEPIREKKRERVVRQSTSDEYEESDEEKELEVFHVKKIVGHIKLNKGYVYRQANGLKHTFDVAAMEKSKFDYAFKVRWRNFGEDDDTWEPIENFNCAMEKKLRKYCRRKEIRIPEGFKEWLLPLSDSDEGSSGSDGSDTESSSKKRSSIDRTSTARSRSPQPSSSRPAKVDVKKEEEKRGKKVEVKIGKKEEEKKGKKEEEKKKSKMLADDLALSPSPSPMRPPKNDKKKTMVDALFDISDDDESKSKKKEKKGEKTPAAKKPPTPKGTPKQEKKKKKSQRDASIDAEDKRKKEEEKKKKKLAEERERKSFIVPDGSESKKEDDEKKKKKKERAELMKKAAEHGKILEEEEKRKKEKKLAAKMEKEKQPPVEAEKPKKVFPATPGKKRDETTTPTTPASSGDRKRSTERGPATPDARREANGTFGTPMRSHQDLEMRKRKRKLEESMKETGSEKKDEDREMYDPRRERKKAEMKDERRERRESEKEERKKEEKKKERKAEERKPLTSFRIPKRPSRDFASALPTRAERAEPEEDEEAKAALKQKRCKKARSRMDVINVRLEQFLDIANQRETKRWEEWEREEEAWRKGMYEQKSWTKSRLIRDVPFDYRAEQRLKDIKYVRTLRRCQSAERLPHSHRRLSSLHCMDSLPSEADSLAAALAEMEIGEEAERHRVLRARIAERKRREEEERRKEPIVQDPMDLHRRTEMFIAETIEMANELMPGMATEETIRDMSEQTIAGFLSLSYSALIPMFTAIHESQCINGAILRLHRIFSPLVRLETADAGCWEACDEGEHRKCRMLMTLLVTLAEPHRMGDGPDCLLPPNALYDALGVSARCQIRAMIRGGCTFDAYYDSEGKNAAHRMMEKCSLSKIVWLMERGLDVNSAIQPQNESDLVSELYDKPWKIVKECHEKMAFVSQIHSNRLTARSVAWTRSVQAVAEYNLRPLTLVHTMTAHAYFHIFAAVTLCDSNRRGFDRDDAVLLAVHAATVTKGQGLQKVTRKSKKSGPELRVPYFLIDQATDDSSFEHEETYQCTKARLTIHNLIRPSLNQTVELEWVGAAGPTTVFKVPKKQAQHLISGRRFTECLLKVDSAPEHCVILAQYFIVPFRNALGKFTD